MSEGLACELELPPELIEAVAQRVADLLRMEDNHAAEYSPWLDVRRAAEYIATTPAAIRALVKRGQIPVHRTPTGRLLFDPAELDRWARGET